MEENQKKKNICNFDYVWLFIYMSDKTYYILTCETKEVNELLPQRKQRHPLQIILQLML